MPTRTGQAELAALARGGCLPGRRARPSARRSRPRARRPGRSPRRRASSEASSERSRPEMASACSVCVRSADVGATGLGVELAGLLGDLALGRAEGELEAGDDLFTSGDLATHVERERHVLGGTALRQRGIGLRLRGAVTSGLDARVGELGVGDLGGGGAQDDTEHGRDRDQQGRAGHDGTHHQQGGQHQQRRPPRSGGCCAGDAARQCGTSVTAGARVRHEVRLGPRVASKGRDTRARSGE